MSKKFHMQENPTEQVVICDGLPGFPENLASTLADYAGGQVQFHVFHEIKRAAQFCEKKPADILLVAEEFPEEERTKIFAASVFVLTGEKSACALRGRLFRYQPADVLWQAISEYEKHSAAAVTFAAEGESLPGEASLSEGDFLSKEAKQTEIPAGLPAEEKRSLKLSVGGESSPELRAGGKDSSGRSAGAESRQARKESGNRQREPPRQASVLRESEVMYRSRAPAQAESRTVRGLVAVYSPVHRIGKTRFALRLARQFAEKTSVLYLNLEGCSGQGGGLFPENGPDLGDLLYYSRQENIHFELKLSTLTEQKDGVDYIRPMKNIQDFYAVKEREWLRLFRKILTKSIYEILILDLGDGADGLFDILKACSRIYTPYMDEPVARAKLAQYEKTLKDIGYGEILARTVKKRMSKDEPD